MRNFPVRATKLAPSILRCAHMGPLAGFASAMARPAEQSGPLRVLFLDIDGVVCCNFRGELEEPKLKLVKRIVDASGAKVVLSSDWRRRHALKDRVNAALGELGVEMIGATPEYAMLSRVRPKEIMSWMRSCDAPIAGWCAIDDRDLVLEVR